MRKSKKRYRRFLSLLAACCCMTAGLTVGCTGRTEQENSFEKEETIVLSVCIAEEQWSEAIEELTELYLKDHPHIEDIQWNLIPKNSYWDLMKMKLATGTLPDIMEVGVGEELGEWYPHLAPLDGMPVLERIFPELLEAGMTEGHVFTVPQAIYGMGILYNSQMLSEAGWDRLPRTQTELRELCEDLEDAGLYQFMNPYHEITTWVECGMLQMISMKPYPKLYIQHLKKGNQKPLSEDREWEALLDFCDLTLMYGNRRPLQLNTELARNYFYIGRYAMILNESSRDLIGMREAGKGVEEAAKIGPMLLSDDVEKNRLLMDTVRLGVAKQSEHAEEAKEFITWLISDEEALNYQKQEMGILPVIEEFCQEGLSSMAEETYQYYLEGRMTDDLMGLLPLGAAESTSAEWARYIAGELSREELTNVYEEYWKKHAEETGGHYGNH